VGDIVHNIADNVLPKELQFLGGLAGGLVDLQTGNPMGAAKNLIDAALDLKDLSQQQSANNTASQTSPLRSTVGWHYEPTPPPTRPQPQVSLSVNVQTTPAPQPSGGWRGTPPAQPPATGWRGTPFGLTSPALAPPTTWRGTPPPQTAPSSPVPLTITIAPANTNAAPAAAPATTAIAPAGTASAPPTTSLAPGAKASNLTPEAFMKLSNQDFMNAISNGDVPDAVAKDRRAMLALQQRMNQITEMNQLMTSMLKAIHDMRMSIIQNVRV
jgi:hypothetical protein